MNFIQLLRRFIPPYKKEVALNVLFHLLATLFSLFSFASIIPVLQILFGIADAQSVLTAWDWSMPMGDLLQAWKNNIFYALEQNLDTLGAGWMLFYLGLFLVIMTFLKTLCSFLGSYYMIPIRTGVLRDLRLQLYRKVISLPIGFFSDERKGDIMARMTGDVIEVEASIMSSLDMIFKNPIMILVYLATMLTMSWELTLFVLILLPISGWLIGEIGKSLKKTSQRGQEQTGELLSQIEETLSGLRIVKAFNAEEKLSSRFDKLNNEIRDTFNQMNRRYTLAHPVSEFLGTAVIAALLWYGGSLILSDNSPIAAAEFIYYIIIFYSIINPAKELSRASYSIRKGKASLERIDKILQTENSITDPTNPLPFTTINSKIEFRDVEFQYQANQPVIRKVNLTVHKGQTVALVGQSGSGKTTMLDLLPRFYDVLSGGVYIDGVNIKDMEVHKLRSQMGNVNQEAILFNDTFFNNISFGVANASRKQVEAAARVANAHDFIMATEHGYESYIGDRGSKLSGGQRQRISIARAILKNPSILILDEATSALDTESEHLVQQALESLMENRTTLVVAHRLSTIKRADMICVMHEGQIVEQGKHDELLALNGYYTKLWSMQK